jgi:hypothetical protein
LAMESHTMMLLSIPSLDRKPAKIVALGPVPTGFVWLSAASFLTVQFCVSCKGAMLANAFKTNSSQGLGSADTRLKFPRLVSDQLSDTGKLIASISQLHIRLNGS